MFSNLQNDVLTVKERTTTQDPSGQILESWDTVIENVPCRFDIAPKDYSNTDDNYKVQTEKFIFFVDASYEDSITKENRISFSGKEYYIDNIQVYKSVASMHHMEIYVKLVSLGGQAGMQSSATVDISQFVLKTTKVNGKSLATDIVLDKTDIGLGNVDNTSDINKPISTATQTALDTKQNIGTNYDDKAFTTSFSGSTGTVTHNMGKFPSVTIIDSAGDEIVGDIVHVSINAFTFTFSASTSGIIYCN